MRGRNMPPDGYTSITVPDEVFEQLTEVMRAHFQYLVQIDDVIFC